MVLETWFSDFKVSRLDGARLVDDGEVATSPRPRDGAESSVSPGPKWAHSFNVLHALGEAYLIGGMRSAKDLTSLDENVYCLNLRTLHWQVVAPAEDAANQGQSASELREAMLKSLAAAGSGSVNSKAPGAAPASDGLGGCGASTSVCARRAFHTATQLSDHELVIFGGWTGTRERDNSVYVFNALRRQWAFPAIRGTVRPEPRQGHSATKINAADIVVYGGWSGDVFCDSLYVLYTHTHSLSLSPPPPSLFR